jgi:hypothetical protein
MPTNPSTQTDARFVVRDATGRGWEWLPDWCVVDTVKQVRVAAYNSENEARKDAAERNEEVVPDAI